MPTETRHPFNELFKALDTEVEVLIYQLHFVHSHKHFRQIQVGLVVTTQYSEWRY